MRERCAEVGGHCEIRESSPGTEVEAWLPLELSHA
jgi:signal transduction histidine kinase